MGYIPYAAVTNVTRLTKRDEKGILNTSKWPDSVVFRLDFVPGMTMQTVLRKTSHCAALDGVRGLSAFFVLLFHVGHWLEIPALSVNGGLSVDTFFTLSGYVLARAYKDRIDLVSNAEFLLQRLVRLMPIIALSLFISAPYVALRNYLVTGDTHIGQVSAAFLLGITNIPYFYAPIQIGGPQIFPLNGPQFSLFFEIVANAFWWSLRRIDQIYLSGILFVLSAFLVVTYGIGGDQANNFGYGFYHVGSSFFAGVFGYHVSTRLAELFKSNLLFYTLLLAMVVLFTMPFELNFEGRMVWKLLLAPLLVLTGATVQLSAATERASVFSGELSYPVYALHYPIFCWTNGLYQRIHGGKSPGIEAVVFIALTMIVSYLALKYYDRPVRRRLASLLPDPRRRSIPRTFEGAS